MKYSGKRAGDWLPCNMHAHVHEKPLIGCHATCMPMLDKIARDWCHATCMPTLQYHAPLLQLDGGKMDSAKKQKNILPNTTIIRRKP